MLILLLSLQPLPAVAMTPRSEPEAAVRVDIIVVNQYTRIARDDDGKYIEDVTFYSSFWNVHWLPPWGMARTPVLEHRGWTKTKPVVGCQDGWATQYGKTLVIAPHLVFLVSEYDFEYANRNGLYRPICP